MKDREVINISSTFLRISLFAIFIYVLIELIISFLIDLLFSFSLTRNVDSDSSVKSVSWDQSSFLVFHSLLRIFSLELSGFLQ